MRLSTIASAITAVLSVQMSVADHPDSPDKTPGLSVTFTAGGQTDARAARLCALYVPKGSPATPFLPAGPFQAKWEGDVASPLRGDYTFSVEVRGQVKVSVNGQQILDAAGAAAAQYADKTVQLQKGANHFVVEYSTDGEDDAQLQLHWASKEFPREPVPPMAWKHRPQPSEFAGARLREGRMLFTQLHCAACHDGGTLVPKDGNGMMETMMTAPDLADAGARFRPGWLAAWIENPRAVRADASMPNLHATKKQAADIAAFLASLGSPAKAGVEKADADAAAAGGGLFANLGCIACHTAPDFSGKDEHARIPLANVAAKFHPVALTEFLKTPSTHSAWTRMPNFRLTDDEAAKLAAYLLTNAKAEFPVVKGDAANGRTLAGSMGCANCHAIPGVEKTTLTAPTLATVLKSGAKGCLSAPAGIAPDFALATGQREALTAFLATDLASLKQDVPAEFADRQIARLNCAACHPRDGSQSTWQHVEDEMTALQNAAPQPDQPLEGAPIAGTAVPHLTWFGEKLQPGWMGAFIAGAAPYKPRPWIAARMPGFGGPAVGIAVGLAEQHGLPLTDLPEPAPDKEKVAIGEKLIGADGGFNCTTCHGVKEQAATAVFEAPGPNLGYTIDRMRKGYYHRWVLAPLRADPETKMPKFSEDGVTTQLSDVLGGKAGDQFEAIWQYLRSLK
jgi:mono/diheme cytochrome c family protein